MTLKISIITATLNSASTIRDCINSIIAQSVEPEHIIVDGGSNDATLELVTRHAKATKVISGPDNGIYDAMNKGISVANGDVIGILNSDDLYANNKVLSKVARVFNTEKIESCYGDLVYVDPMDTKRITRYWKSGIFNQRSFYWGWMPPHPTYFVRRCVYEKFGGFNLGLGSAADYELMLRFCVKKKITTQYIPEVLVKMRLGGVSNISLRNRIKANRMDRKAWRINGLKPFPWTCYLKPLRKLRQYYYFSDH
jgi:glycosyltransferase involved in cell wall biosynthesis